MEYYDSNAKRRLSVKARNKTHRQIPANYYLFVSPTLCYSNSNTQSETTSGVSVDSLRLHCSLISLEVLVESKQIN